MKFLVGRQQLAAMYVKVEATLRCLPCQGPLADARDGSWSYGTPQASTAGQQLQGRAYQSRQQLSRIAPAHSLPRLHNTPTHITTMAPVTFWAAPRQYINWAARHKPAILWSLVLGSFGPLIVVCQTASSACRQLCSPPIAKHLLCRPPFPLSASASATPTVPPFLSHTRVSAYALYSTAAEQEAANMLEYSVYMEYKEIN